MTNHYETLGLKRTDTQQEIEMAYQKLSQKFHPDKNDGDEYFSEMYRNIQEAYDVLSNETKKVAYDSEKNINEVDASKDSHGDVNPKILYFEADKDSFVEGDTIELKWETRNADKIIIKPFGELENSGSKMFKLKNFNKTELSIALKATNSLSGETLTKTIKLKNKVTEFDFSEFEEDEQNSSQTDSSNIPESEPIGETVTSNSFEQTAPQPETFEKSEPQQEQEQVQESFFSIKGRLRRSTYIGRALLLGIPVGITTMAIQESYDETTIFLSAILMLFCSVLIFIQFIKRLHDINLSGWFSLINFIPYVGALFGLVILFIDGKKGENQYGIDPKNR
jgi:curved DNA-binding protein CbpA